MLSRIQLATYFKQQAFEVIGITPQRLGQQIGQTNTATGVEQALAGSYAQTETYFIQHCDNLMPRVHQMRTDLAQYYHSKKPSIRLQYITSNDEKVNFQINGTDLLARDLNIYATTRANHRSIVEQMKQLVFNNNTTGASIFDLGNVMQAESLSELNHVLKATEAKSNKQRQEQMAHEQQLKQMEIEQRTQEKQMELDRQSLEKEKDRRRDLLVAEIKSAGYGAMQDINQNLQSDYVDALNVVKESEEFQQTMQLSNQKENNKTIQNDKKNLLAEQKIQAQMAMKQMDLDIARENKNRFDVQKEKPKEKKKK